MSADPRPGWRPWRSQPQKEEDPGPRTGPGAQLGEPGKYAYAALCAVSLASLFPDQEDSAYRTGVVENLVRWLELSDAVMPSMLAFAGGLGAEGTETFARILLDETLLKDQPGAIMLDLLSFSLKDGYYDARMRVLLSHMACLLRIPLAELEDAEDYLLECLKEEKEAESETDEGKRKKKERRKRLKRYLLIGLATVGGGTVIGLTGGLAAPLVGLGAATIIGTAGATALGSVAGMAIIGSLFGAAGAGLVGYKMKKRVGAIEEFEFLPLTEEKQLHITIAITGWLSPGKYGSFTAPWSSLLQSKEQYCLAWESKYLLELGSALDALWNGLVNMVAQEALKYTVLAGIVTALTWPASLLAVAGVIDNPWGVCLHRSAEVGKHLAQILLSRQQGKRPVTLVGFSLGARVIYFCLQEMAKEKDCEGIIEDVVLLGAPVEGDPKPWKLITKVISGKIINGFCRLKDVNSSALDREMEIDAASHQCVFCFRLNKRLFTVPTDPESACPVCKTPRAEKPPETLVEPAFVRVSFPRATFLPVYKHKIHRRKSYEMEDNLALPSHCLAGWENPIRVSSPIVSSLDLHSSLDSQCPYQNSVSRLAGRTRTDELLDRSRVVEFELGSAPRKQAYRKPPCHKAVFH